MKSWRELTDEQREALPLGDMGWRYKRGSMIAKGQWKELLREPETYPRGAVVTSIIWCSNGVGTPSMRLVGKPSSIDGPDPEYKPGYFPMKGGFMPMGKKKASEREPRLKK